MKSAQPVREPELPIVHNGKDSSQLHKKSGGPLVRGRPAASLLQVIRSFALLEEAGQGAGRGQGGPPYYTPPNGLKLKLV